jgi:hypothetical protein
METFRSEDAKPSRTSRLAFLRRAGTLGAAAAGAGALARPAPTEVVRIETVEREGAATLTAAESETVDARGSEGHVGAQRHP